MSIPLLTAVLAVTILAAIVQGSLGLGLALVASPGLSLINSAFVPAPVLAAALVSSLWMMYRDRQHGLGPYFLWTLAGIPVGIPIGLILLRHAPTSVLMLALGITVLVLAPLTASRRLALPANPVTLSLGGLLSALGGATVGLTGPTVAIVYHDLSPHMLRMTMAVYLTIVQTVVLLTMAGFGGIGGQEWMLIALTVPGTAIGLLASGPIAKTINADVARRAVIWVCCLAGLSVTTKALFFICQS